LIPAPSSAFGLALYPQFTLPGLPPRNSSSDLPAVELRAVSRERLRPLWSDAAGEPIWETMLGPGASYAVLAGCGGDHLILYRGAPSFHLSADGTVLSCVEAADRDADWTRMLLDTALWSVALLRDVALLHAGAVLSPQGVVAIAGAQGGGKSTLVAQLLGEGWRLFADDILAYRTDGDRVIAYPGPALMNLSTRAGATHEPQAIGRVLATFGEDSGSQEAWVQVEQEPIEPQPLRALVLLAREGENRDMQVRRVTDGLLKVIPHSLAFRRRPGALRARYEAASDLIVRVPVFCVSAGLAVPPAELSAILRTALDSIIDFPSSII
jgi:hypothetical protein